MNEQRPVRAQKKGLLSWGCIFLLALGVTLFVPVVCTIGIVAYVSYSEAHRPVVGDAVNASGQYYAAIQKHDYTTAYTYLDSHATITVHGHPVVMNSVGTLAITSQAFDTRQGLISSYIATDGNFEQGSAIVDLTLKVTRTGQPYEVHLKIELVGSDWKILNADGI
jgi:hypothetical protein